MSIAFNPHSPTSRQIDNRSPAWRAGLGTVLLRAALAIAKRAYPAVIVLALCFAAVATTIAIRLAAWLPMYLSH
jgi:hypothetical protein